jgi:predicted flavoprotein YhiN
MSDDAEVIVIGAGPAGLVATAELAGRRVLLLVLTSPLKVGWRFV